MCRFLLYFMCVYYFIYLLDYCYQSEPKDKDTVDLSLALSASKNCSTWNYYWAWDICFLEVFKRSLGLCCKIPVTWSTWLQLPEFSKPLDHYWAFWKTTSIDLEVLVGESDWTRLTRPTFKFFTCMPGFQSNHNSTAVQHSALSYFSSVLPTNI